MAQPTNEIPKINLGDIGGFIGGLPSAAGKVFGTIGKTFLPATSEFLGHAKNVLSEGIALSVSPDLQKAVEGGNLDILPTITRGDLKSQVTKIGKKAAGAALEATIYKVIPASLTQSLKARYGIGALQGVGFAVSEGLAKDYSTDQIIKNAKSYALWGAAGEAVAPYLGRLLNTDIKKIPSSVGSILKGASEEAKLAGIRAGSSIEDVSKNFVEGESVSWQGRIYEIKQLTDKNVRITDNKGFEAIVPHNEIEVIKPTNVENLKQEVDNLKLEIGYYEDVLSSDPTKQLAKYGGKYRKGELPEVTGELGAGEYRQKGDQFAASAGFEDITHAQTAYENYVKGRDNLKILKQKLKEKKLALQSELVKNKPAAEALEKYQAKKSPDIPVIDAEEMAYLQAQTESIGGEFKKIGALVPDKSGAAFKRLGTELQKEFQNYVNKRHAATFEGFIKKQEFKNLDDLGFEGIIQFQAGENQQKFGDLRKYFNLKYRELIDAGIEVGYEENYAPQIWKNSIEEVSQVLGRRIGNRPTFTFEKIIEDYQAGLKAGLTPRFNKLSELAEWYEYSANKAMADKSFIDFLTSNNFIAPRNRAPLGWKSLDPDWFPLKRVKTKEGTEYIGNFMAPPELADVLNNYLRPGNETLASFANVISSVKNMVLSSGWPMTGLNAHGFNILYRNILANGPVKGFLQGSYYLMRPAAAKEMLMSDLQNAVFSIKSGLTMTAEDHAMTELERGLTANIFSKVRDWHRRVFEEPLFNNILPALKLQKWNVIFSELQKYYPRDEAGKLAATITNNMFGGLNIEQIGRSRDFQNFLRTAILAPDWMETNFKNIPIGLFTKGKAGGQYRAIIKNLAMTYIAANITNKMLSGHWMFENEPGHEFQIEVGKTYSGKTRHLKFAGTGADFARIPHDVILALAKGDLSVVSRIIRNRLSIPLGVGSSLLFNVDYAGRPILNKDKYGNPIPVKEQVGGVAAQLSELFLPQYSQATIDGLSGRSDWEQAFTQSLEFPISYGSKPPRKKRKR